MEVMYDKSLDYVSQTKTSRLEMITPCSNQTPWRHTTETPAKQNDTRVRNVTRDDSLDAAYILEGVRGIVIGLCIP